MSLAEQTPRTDAILSTSTDEIPFTYPFADDSELLVISDGRGTLVLTTDYTVTGAGEDNGGTVTMVAGVIGEQITILRNTPISQILVLRVNGKYFVTDVEAALDKLTKIDQELAEEIARCMKLPNTETGSLVLPASAQRVLKSVAFDASGDLLLIDTLDQGSLDAAVAAAEASAVASAASAGASAASAVESSDSAAESAGYASDSSISADESAASAVTSASEASDSATSAAESAASAVTSEASSVSSAASASASATSALEAAASALQLDQVANNLTYKGNTTGTAAPSSPQAGWFYTITSAGTFGSITWAIGDLALYDGSAWHKQDIDSLIQQEINDRKAADNPKAFAGGVFVGTDSWVDTGVSGNFSQNQPFSVVWVGSNIAGTGTLIGNLRNVGSYNTGAWGLREESSQLKFSYEYGAGRSQTQGTPMPAGERVFILCNVTPSTGLVEMYVDGVLRFSQTLGGGSGMDLSWSSHLWLLASKNGGSAFDSNQKQSGTCSGYALFNTTLTATQVSEIYEQGVSGWLAANPEYRWGSPLDIMAGWDFTSGWAASNSTIDDHDSFTTVAAGGVVKAIGTVVGQTYKLRVAATTTSTLVQVWETDTTSPTELLGTVSGGVLEIEYVARRTRIYIRNTTAGVTDVTEISLIQVGCLSHLPMDEGIGYQLHDQSTNHHDALLSETGCTHLQPKREGFVRDFNVDAYNGGGAPVELVSSSRDVLPTGAVLTGVMAHNVGGVDVDNFAVGKSDRLVPTTVATFSGNFTDSVFLPVGVNNQWGSDANVAITSTDTDATDLDIRVDYKLID